MEIGRANLYEINQQLSSQEKIMGPKERERRAVELRSWFREHTYFMLLCHDRRDFTLFRIIESRANAVDILFECLDNRGSLVSIDKDSSGNNAWEIWIRVPDERDYCYFLFPYDDAIIEC